MISLLSPAPIYKYRGCRHGRLRHTPKIPLSPRLFPRAQILSLHNSNCTCRIKWGATKGTIHFCGESVVVVVCPFHCEEICPARCCNMTTPSLPSPLLCSHCCPEISLSPSLPPRLTARMQMLSFPLFCWLTVGEQLRPVIFFPCARRSRTGGKRKGDFSPSFFYCHFCCLLNVPSFPLIRVPFHPSQQVAVRG